jgi:hypothetical protein
MKVTAIDYLYQGLTRGLFLVTMQKAGQIALTFGPIPIALGFSSLPDVA